MSIVESSDQECNRILEIGRKLGMHTLHWRNRWKEESTKNNQALIDIFRSGPHIPANSLKRDKRMTAETSEGPNLGIACASDDPRRGARLKNTVSKETKTGSSNTSPTRGPANDNMSDDLHTLRGRELDDIMSLERGSGDPYV